MKLNQFVLGHTFINRKTTYQVFEREEGREEIGGERDSESNSYCVS